MLRKSGTLIAIFAIAGVVLAGCGSSATNRPAAASTVTAHQTPLMSNPDAGGARQQGNPATVLADKSRVATAKVAKARQTPSTSNDEYSTTGAKPANPCALVSLSEAQNITGGAITKMIEAPLGPTCIYSGGTRRAARVTLAVETESLSQVTRHMRPRKHLVINGHRSLCGRLGAQMLFVPLDRYQLLHVTAPCGIAQRFAAVAVSRLSA